MKLRYSMLIVVIIVAGTFDIARATQNVAPTPYQLLLRSRQFVPQPGVEQAARSAISVATGPQHVFIQLNDIPDSDARRQLAARGIQLLHYLPDHAWLASLNPSLISSPDSVPGMRWVGLISASDKVPANLFAGKPMSRAVRPGGMLALEVKYFDDVAESAAIDAVARHSRVFETSLAILHRIAIRLPANQVRALAAEDVVEWIEETPPLPTPSTDSIRSRIRVNEVQAAPYNLTGSSVKIGIWDCSFAGPHVDFSGRLTIAPGTTGSCPSAPNHATHVAGIMAGSGANSQSQGGAPFQWKGMAPGAQVFSYDFNNTGSTVPNAQSTYGIDLAQNSWSYPLCGGTYTSISQFYDQTVRGAFSQAIPVVFSAGNARSSPSCPDPYHSVTPPATAKNVIAVGATDAINDDMTYFSSWGPAEDGRTKPDLVAPGYRSDNASGIVSTFPNNSYGTDFGTSMAAPAVSGMLALMLQQYRISTGQPLANPAPSTLKAAAVQGAIDLGNPGPDFKFGWGRVDAKNSVDLVRRGKYLEGTVGDGQTLSYLAPIQACNGPLKVTLVWDDPSAADIANPAYINDLDLTLVAPNASVFRPWLLDPANPGAAASTGTDFRNNVEQVQLLAPAVGNWTIRVFGHTVASMSQQRFSLASEALPVVPTLSSLSQTVVVPGQQIVLHGSEFGCAQGSGSVTFGGGVFGTISAGNWTNDAITVTVPLNAQTGGVVVTSAGGASAPLALAVLRPTVYLPAIVRNFPPAFSWIDASDGVRVADGDDVSTAIALPFPLKYFGNTYLSVTISSNGFISFGSLLEAYPTSVCVPDAGLPNNAIYGFWHDLDPTNNNGLDGPRGAIWYKNLGNKVVIEWQNVPRWNTQEYETFEIILDTTNAIIMQYQQVNNVRDVAIGYEDGTGTAGGQSYCHQSVPPVETGAPPVAGSLIYYSPP